jgi:hypothetical protein
MNLSDGTTAKITEAVRIATELPGAQKQPNRRRLQPEQWLQPSRAYSAFGAPRPRMTVPICR